MKTKVIFSANQKWNVHYYKDYGDAPKDAWWPLMKSFWRKDRAIAYAKKLSCELEEILFENGV